MNGRGENYGIERIPSPRMQALASLGYHKGIDDACLGKKTWNEIQRCSFIVQRAGKIFRKETFLYEEFIRE